MRYLLIALFSVFLITPVKAGEYCYNETIGYLITTSTEIYFTTDKSCSGWCQVNASWSTDQKNRAYSQLALAHSTGRTITLFWPAASTACESLPTYSVPAYFLVPGP